MASSKRGGLVFSMLGTLRIAGGVFDVRCGVQKTLLFWPGRELVLPSTTRGGHWLDALF